MHEIDLFNRFAVTSAVAFGAGVSGVGLLLFGPKKWFGRGAALAAGVGTAGGVTALFTPQYAGTVFAVGGGLAAVLLLAGLGGVQRRIGAVLRAVTRPRVAGGLVLLAALVGWGLSAWQFDAQTEQIVEQGMEQFTDPPLLETAPAAVPAATDRGTPLTLSTPTDPLSAEEVTELEAHAPSIALHAPHLIRRGPASDESNCHGWVFAGGKYNLGGRLVPTILAENGYQNVSRPAPGDVCVYQSQGGEVAHSAVVRAVLDDGTVLVEGKWGRMGVYLHPATESCYGQDFTFHRTARGGHLLRGLDPSAAAATAASNNP